MRATIALACLLAAAAPAESQTDPLRCWWRSSAGAVAIGETFTATLTCAVREEAETRTVPDESRLAAAVVQLAPFEVLAGDRPADLRSPTHRFFQYHYTLRIIDRDVIGQDATFPDLQIPYRVHSLTNGEWTAGRDRTYAMPGQSVRVSSLVPADAADIRDSSESSFTEVGSLRFRARALEIATYVFLLLSAIVAAPAVWALSRRRVVDPDKTRDRIPHRAVVRAVAAELEAVERERAGGWTPGLAARGLRALRLTSASALDWDISSRPLTRSEAAGDRVVFTHGLWKKRRFGMSASMTPAHLRAALSALPDTATATRRHALQELSESMHAFSAALYRETFESGSHLDEAFTAGSRAARQLIQR
jgi:hypothetical protein